MMRSTIHQQVAEEPDRLLSAQIVSVQHMVHSGQLGSPGMDRILLEYLQELASRVERLEKAYVALNDKLGVAVMAAR